MKPSNARTGSESSRPRLCDRFYCDDQAMSDFPRAQRFPTTHWSRVLRAGDPTDREGRDALERLCRDYWYPLYAFARRQGLDRDEAGDLVQGFLADLIERRDLSKADPTRGRFRSFLRTACSHFLSHAREHDRALKRGGGRAPVSIDLQDAEGRYFNEPAHDLTAERLFERRWAMVLLEHVLARLESEARLAGKSDLFAHLRPLLEGDELEESYKEIGDNAADERGFRQGRRSPLPWSVSPDPSRGSRSDRR